MALLGWVAGCATIWSSLFTVGNFLYGRLNHALLLLIVFIVSAMVLLFVIHALWSEKEQPKTAASEADVLETVAGPASKSAS
jgi:TM2 domain-containing membrane protein YozV